MRMEEHRQAERTKRTDNPGTALILPGFWINSQQTNQQSGVAGAFGVPPDEPTRGETPAGDAGGSWPGYSGSGGGFGGGAGAGPGGGH